MSRIELGQKAACSASLVAKIETGSRVPQLSFAEVCDEIFPHSQGRFARLWPLAMRYAFPPWFRPYVELEWKATVVAMFHPQFFPGLVQTPEYAREMLRAGRPNKLDDLVTARIERQRILTREDPARLWVILNESVLKNCVGSSTLMRAQLTRLRDLAETPHHRVQIIPSAKFNGLVGSPFGLLSFKEGADVVHVEGFPKGYLLADPADVEMARDGYDLLKSMACPPDESAEMLDSVSKEWYS
ncbi:Helix-turn-helix protein (plasmid) [Streptomyces clavuligerus]|uniref:Helix-turn-helix protein n=2 Tax=Streptomyces clavuligerus TaxID=1901 RepID=D5SKB4_STRCL|nr:Helix-turn-helix protein [Streptomyces clavuligerus]